MAVVVSDTSPIRALWHLERMDLLHALFEQVLIPPAVVRELEEPHSRLVPVPIRSFGFVQVVAPVDQAVVHELAEHLEAGEAEAIALALQVHADAVLIDEAAGREAVRQRGLVPVGALGILIRAKRRGLVEAVTPLIDRLQNDLGFFISAAVRAEILRQAGE